MLIRILIVLLLTATLARAQGVPSTYLIFSTQAAALARSQAMCASFGAAKCDGTLTKYWWNVVGPLNAGTAQGKVVTAGSYAVEIQNVGPYATNGWPACALCGLTPTEKTNSVTAVQLAPLMPIVGP